VEEPSVVKKHYFDLGMVLSSMIAYNGGSISDRPGIAGGVLSQYNISDKIGVGSGIIVSHHQYQMAGLFLYKSDLDEEMDNLTYGNSYVTESNEDFSITAIDIPLNFTFKPGTRKDKGIFFTMGVSSFVYLDERYSSQMTEFTNNPVYNNETGDYTSVYTVESYPVEENHKALSRFDFAKQLNLSFGYLINFDAGSLAIEPYIKLPLAPMTHKDLLMGYGGIGLVFKPHFLKNKKKD
ncbi:MAG: PorT family protein, partial [Bacteroidales bacterium]|nr:PorT family protein [Bacteroidales bacterium]